MKPPMNMQQAVALLDAKTKHWRLQCENSGGRRYYSVKAWAKDTSMRFEIGRCSPLEAMIAALDRLDGRAPAPKRLRAALGRRPPLRLAD